MTVTSRCTSTMKKSEDTYHVYAYTRPASYRTRTQQDDVSAHKDLRHVGQGSFIGKDSIEGEARVHIF